jgi:hypothetical protein
MRISRASTTIPLLPHKRYRSATGRGFAESHAVGLPSKTPSAFSRVQQGTYLPSRSEEKKSRSRRPAMVRLP